MTKSLAHIKERLEGRIANLNEQIEKWKDEFSENPQKAVYWSQRMFDQVAEVEVAMSILVGVKYFLNSTPDDLRRNSDIADAVAAGVSVETMFDTWLQRTAIEKMDFTTGSMQSGNLYNSAMNRAWAHAACHVGSAFVY